MATATVARKSPVQRTTYQQRIDNARKRAAEKGTIAFPGGEGQWQVFGEHDLYTVVRVEGASESYPFACSCDAGSFGFPCTHGATVLNGQIDG